MPRSGYVVEALTDFAGGLSLLDQAAVRARGVALDLLNVRMDSDGGIGSRPGSARLTDSALFTDVDSVGAYADEQLVVAAGARVQAIAADGTVGADGTITDNGPMSFAGFGTPEGTPLGSRVYGANGANLVYYDGSAWTVDGTVTVDSVAAQAPPKPRCVAVTPWDNRLVAAGFGAVADGPAGAGGKPGIAYLSEPGDPTTWNAATVFEQFHPGDGEELVAAVSWQDKLFLFKQTKFFVMHGTVSDGDGNPSFQYYAVDTGLGVEGPLAACAGRDGVYFVTRRGVYRTQGNEPVPVSIPLEPLFGGQSAPYYTGPLPDLTALGLASIQQVGELVYVALQSLTGGFLLVYDTRFDNWMVDDLAADSIVMFPAASGRESLVFANGDHLYRHDQDLVGDEDSSATAVAFDSYWRSSWTDYGVAGEKTIRSSHGWGEGTVALRYSTDLGALGVGGQFGFSVDADIWSEGDDPDDVWAEGDDDSDKWATGAVFSDDWVRGGFARGTLHSFELRGVGINEWSVQRLEDHLAGLRRASKDTSG